MPLPLAPVTRAGLRAAEWPRPRRFSANRELSPARPPGAARPRLVGRSAEPRLCDRTGSRSRRGPAGRTARRPQPHSLGSRQE
eukprot:762796-Hanusia_phi.AAC.1